MNNFVKQNWFKIIVAIAISIVAISVAYYLFTSSQKKLPTATSNIFQSNLADQKTCAEQAQKYMQDNAMENQANPAELANGTTVDATNYYNPKLGRCFLNYRVDSTNGFTSIELIDVFSGEMLADFLSTGDTDVCTTTNDDSCTFSEFNDYVNQYVNN